MNDTLRIVTINGVNRLAGSAPFDPHHQFSNRYREISVLDPDDPYGVPLYEGPAHGAGAYLVPGSYKFEWLETFYD